MVLHNDFLIGLINSQRSSNIVNGEEFNHKDVFSNIWDEFCIISYEDYLANQNDESFLTDITKLDVCNAKVGIVIRNVTELSAEKANKLNGKVRIYMFDSEEERMASHSYLHVDEYIKARKELDKLMTQVDLSELDKLKIAKQMYVLLRNQYEHAFPSTGDFLTDIRYSQNMYGCLCLHKGVCAGGANTFRAMCSLADIKCKKICINTLFSNNSEVGHALNQICVNGEWGIVDVEQKKEIPEDTSLFFCNEDDYEAHWRDKEATYTVNEFSCPLTPTNISVSREYIDSLDSGIKLATNETSAHQTTGRENLRTLAVSEISSGKITVSNLENIHLREWAELTIPKEEVFQNDSIS